MIPEFFKGVKGFNTTTKLKTDDLTFYDSVVENSVTTKFNTGTIITIVLTLVMVLLVVISSIIMQCRI